MLPNGYLPLLKLQMARLVSAVESRRGAALQWAASPNDQHPPLLPAGSMARLALAVERRGEALLPAHFVESRQDAALPPDYRHPGLENPLEDRIAVLRFVQDTKDR